MRRRPNVHLLSVVPFRSGRTLPVSRPLETVKNRRNHDHLPVSLRFRKPRRQQADIASHPSDF